MPRRDWRTSWAPWLVLAACLLLFGYGLAGTPYRALFDDVDRALIARNMADRGDWLTPWYHDRPLYTKPPLLYWLGAASYRLLGRRDELPANLVSVACATLTALATWAMGRRLLGGRAGLFGALTLATAYLFLTMARQPMIDMVMTAGLTIGLGALVRLRFGPAGTAAAGVAPDGAAPAGAAPGGALAGGAPGTAACSWILAALGLSAAILSKGPLPLPLFALAALPLAWRAGALRAGGPRARGELPQELPRDPQAERDSRSARRPGRRRPPPWSWRRLRGPALLVGLTAALVLPWFLIARGRSPLAEQTWRAEFLGRLGEARPGRPWPQKPWWFYLADMRNFLPWLLLLPAALGLAFRRWRQRRWLFLLVWGLGGLLLFSFVTPSKRSYYLLPIYPPLAMMVGGLWAAALDERPRRELSVEPAPGGEAAAGAGAEPDPVAGPLEPWIRGLLLAGAGALAAALLAVGIGAPVAAREFALRPLLLFVAGGFAAAVAGLFAVRALARRRLGRVWGLLLAGVAAVELVYVGHVVPPLNAQLSGKAFFEEAAPIIGREPAAAVDLGFSLPSFYLDRDDLELWRLQDLDRDLARHDVRFVLADPRQVQPRPELELVLARRYAARLGGVREFALYRLADGEEAAGGRAP